MTSKLTATLPRFEATVIAGTRLHLGLVDMGQATHRAFGGIGCILEEPSVSVTATTAVETSIGPGFSVDASRRLLDILRRFTDSRGLQPVRVVRHDRVPSHSGLGASTASTLAALVACCLVNEVYFEDAVLQLASGRGGTSGVGVHGFFSGGWIVDVGQRRPVPNLPSRAQRGRPPSLLLTRLPPPHWVVALFLVDGTGPSGDSEIKFFQDTVINEDHTLRALATLHHGLVPALMECDFPAFATALAEYQRLGFKDAEIRLQGTQVQELIAELTSLCPAVGLSSLGPLVFAFYPSSNLYQQWRAIARTYDCSFWVTRVSNVGWSRGEHRT